MTVDNGVRIVAGCMLLLSLILTTWVHPGFVWLSAFVGVNLIQSVNRHRRGSRGHVCRLRTQGRTGQAA